MDLGGRLRGRFIHYLIVMSAFRCMYRPRRLLLERLEQRLPMCAGPVAMQPPVEMSAYEQEMLELINRSRANPSAEATRQGISLNDGLPAGTLGTEARQPLAPSASANRCGTGTQQRHDPKRVLWT